MSIGWWHRFSAPTAQDPYPAAGVLDYREHVQPCPGQGDRFEEVAGKQGLSLGAQEIGPRGGAALGCRVDPGLVQDLPDGGGGDLYPEHQQLAVYPAVPPPGILADQAQHQGADRAHGPRSSRACRRATTLRCQRSTVSGRTTRCSRLRTFLGSRCSSAASKARSAGVNRTLSGPSCRWRTESWWRSTRISASLSRLLIGSSRSSANTFVMPR
jgi:hypothetical protein